MITTLQSVLLGALQGFTELFPISSLGHSVLLPPLLGWNIDQHSNFFIIFLIATHLATACVLVGFFWNDIWKIAAGFFRSLWARCIPEGDTYARLAWLIIIATAPAGALGLLFEEHIRGFFASPTAVAFFLIGNGALLYGAELLRKRRAAGANSHDDDVEIAGLPFLKALGIGFMQALALFPGFSRTGASLAGGLLSGLSHAAAARFAFLLATPIIVAAAALKLPELLLVDGYPIAEILLGSVVSAFAAWFSITFLTKYFRTNTLVPFSLYCIAAGVVSLILLSL